MEERRDRIVSTSLKKAFQLSFLSVRTSKTKRRPPGPRCLEINSPDSEELFNESMQFPSGIQSRESTPMTGEILKFLGYELRPLSPAYNERNGGTGLITYRYKANESTERFHGNTVYQIRKQWPFPFYLSKLVAYFS